jgi:histidinol phosphatase-like PHP family hydrolase
VHDIVLTRRALLGMTTGVLAANSPPDAAVELMDFHAHIDAVGTLDALLEISRQKGVRFGVVEHAGNRNDHRYRGLLANDDDLSRYLQRLEGKPCLKGIQAEGLDWMQCFSPRMVARLDYVLTDALTFPEKNGALVRLWTPAVRIDDKQDFMDRYTAHHLRVIETEPIDILANPLFLPLELQPEAEALWTDARTGRILRAAIANNVAFEINSRFRLPGLKFLRQAKAAGAKFSFGSNILGPGVGDVSYGREVVKELKLRKSDLFVPAPAGRRPIQVRKFAS